MRSANLEAIVYHQGKAIETPVVKIFMIENEFANSFLEPVKWSNALFASDSDAQFKFQKRCLAIKTKFSFVLNKLKIKCEKMEAELATLIMYAIIATGFGAVLPFIIQRRSSSWLDMEFCPEALLVSLIIESLQPNDQFLYTNGLNDYKFYISI